MANSNIIIALSLIAYLLVAYNVVTVGLRMKKQFGDESRIFTGPFQAAILIIANFFGPVLVVLSVIVQILATPFIARGPVRMLALYPLMVLRTNYLMAVRGVAPFEMKI